MVDDAIMTRQSVTKFKKNTFMPKVSRNTQNKISTQNVPIQFGQRQCNIAIMMA